MVSTEPFVAVGRTRSRRQAEDWSLVLTAEQIRNGLQFADGEFRILVQDADVERSAEALRGFEQDRLPAVERRPPRAEYGPTSVGFVVAAALPLFFWITQLGSLAWAERGAADSARILQGELWRAVTALTLHADVGHVFGNALGCALFASLLFRALGPGLGATLMVGGGALANGLNAWLQGPGHESVGASSAVFAAVGVLVGLQCAERWRLPLHRRRAWLPLAAGLGLLAFLGTGGERTDIAAHGLGLMTGVPLGIAAGACLHEPPRPAAQAWLLAGVLALFIAAWLCAFSA